MRGREQSNSPDDPSSLSSSYHTTIGNLRLLYIADSTHFTVQVTLTGYSAVDSSIDHTPSTHVVRWQGKATARRCALKTTT